MVGIKNSEIVILINSDRDAPILNVLYAIVILLLGGTQIMRKEILLNDNWLFHNGKISVDRPALEIK